MEGNFPRRVMAGKRRTQKRLRDRRGSLSHLAHPSQCHPVRPPRQLPPSPPLFPSTKKYRKNNCSLNWFTLIKRSLSLGSLRRPLSRQQKARPGKSRSTRFSCSASRKPSQTGLRLVCPLAPRAQTHALACAWRRRTTSTSQLARHTTAAASLRRTRALRQDIECTPRQPRIKRNKEPCPHSSHCARRSSRSSAPRAWQESLRQRPPSQPGSRWRTLYRYET